MPAIRTITAQQFVQLAIESGRRLELNVAMVEATCDYCTSIPPSARPYCHYCGGNGTVKVAFPMFGTQYGA